MGNLLLSLLGLVLVLISFGGCDKQEPVVTNSDQNTAVVIDAPSPPVSAHDESLHILILPAVPTAKTSLYARVSGARERVRFNWAKNGKTIAGAETALLAAEFFAKGDIIEVEAFAGALRASVSVVINNSPPAITAVKFNYGSVVTVMPQGQDPDGDTIGYRYQWSINDEALFVETTNVLPGELFTKGDRVAVAITPYDQESDGATIKLKDVLIDNKPPVITSIPPSSFENSELSYKVRAEDPEGESLSYSLETAPDEMTIDSQTGMLHWSVGEDVTGSQLVKVKVEDASGRWVIQEFSLDLQDSNPGK